MKLLQKHAVLFTLFFTLLLAFAAPYLIPAEPDASVFRSGSFGALLIVFGAFTVRRSLEKSDLRALKYGLFFALIFSFLLGLGSELTYYGKLLSGFGSLVRRFAVPLMASPYLGALFALALSFEPERSKHSRLPFLFFFLLFAGCYTLILLAKFPGILNYDFEFEIAQYLTGVYEVKHPVFHSMLLGWLYSLGNALFGSMTAGAAAYSIFQILCLAAAHATVCRFVQRRVPRLATLILTACFAFLPFHGVLAISTVKDALFSALCALLCILLWRIAENPEGFMASRRLKAAFIALCLLMGLIRLNGLFAFIPACIAVITLCKSHKKQAVLLCAAALILSLGVPRALNLAVHAEKSSTAELMSIPCQQLMRTAERAPISEEEYAEINTWFSDQTHRYRPHSADPAKGGNFDYARYQADPSAYWSLYFRYLKRYPAIYLEAFLDNCMGLWYPDDMSHSHSLDSEDWDYVYLKGGNIVPEILGDIDAKSYIPRLTRLLYLFTQSSRHELIPLVSLLFRPSLYVFLMLFITLYMRLHQRRAFISAVAPLWGIFLSLLFSACILVRYVYPIMAALPPILMLMLYSKGADCRETQPVKPAAQAD